MAKMTVEDTSLIAVADAIRAKGETTEQLVFPDGFVSAIGGIRGGLFFAPLVDKIITEVTADMLAGCTKIGNRSFYVCKNLTSIEIPEGVTIIEDYAFLGCSSLPSIVIPEGVTTIKIGAFEDCKSLASIVLPESLTSLGDGLFYGCSSLPSIVIPEGVTKIGPNTFMYCSSLTTIEMKRQKPPTLSSTNVFTGCHKLTTIIVPAGTLEAYQSATNWSTYASKMVEAKE